MIKEYRTTEKAGRFVAGQQNTGAGRSIWLTDKAAEWELAQGTIVPVEPEGEAEAAPRRRRRKAEADE